MIIFDSIFLPVEHRSYTSVAFKTFFKHLFALKPFENTQEFVPQVFETGCKPVLLLLYLFKLVSVAQRCLPNSIILNKLWYYSINVSMSDSVIFSVILTILVDCSKTLMCTRVHCEIVSEDRNQTTK